MVKIINQGFLCQYDVRESVEKNQNINPWVKKYCLKLMCFLIIVILLINKSVCLLSLHPLQTELLYIV